MSMNKKRIAFTVFALVLVVAAVVGFFYVQYKKTHISTDDAFIEGTVYTVSARVNGTVEQVLVDDNQFVKKGQLLVVLDREPFDKKLKQALAMEEAEKQRLKEIEAALLAQKRKIQAREAELNRRLTERKELKALVKARTAELKAKEARFEQAKLDLQRAENLYKKGVIPKQKYDRALTLYQTALAATEASGELKRQAELKLKGFEKVIAQTKAALKAEQAAYKRIQASIKAQKGLIKRAHAVVEEARLMLSYTRVYAPSDGYVTKKAVHRGEQIKAGQPLLAVVPLDGVYVVANYKETKIESIKKGMKVKIKVDAYPDLTLWGRVDSLMAGTGATFTLFPPENATGNYVKVVQRIPVKIVITEGLSDKYPLRIGMSVVPTVLVR
ncbi:MAG: HlyD family secretion protein [Nitrospirae bacterium]|nr:HlyD family secretion protein [Nitrospirota bacterium]